MTTAIRVCASGELWVGGGVGSLQTALHEAVQSATDEIVISCFSVTSGAQPLVTELHAALRRGILVRMIVNRLAQQAPSAVSELKRLATEYPHFELWDFVGEEGSDLHAKVLCVDRQLAVLGSSNLSFRGLVTSYELGVVVTGPPAQTIAERIGTLLSTPLVTRV